MDTTKLQTSFIPNKDIAISTDSSSGGILSLLGTTLFIVTLLSSIGVFGYQRYLESTIASMNIKLEEARKSLDPELISQITRTNTRFVSAQELIAGHRVPTSFLDLLSKITLKTVRFTSLTYETDKSGIVQVKMKGTARSYATIAAQAKIINEESLIIAPQFSNLDLNKEGDVTFDFKATLDKKILMYEKTFVNDTDTGAPVVTTVTASSTFPIATTTKVTTVGSSTPSTSTPITTVTSTKKQQ